MKIISPTSVTFEGLRGLSKNVGGKAMYESEIDNGFRRPLDQDVHPSPPPPTPPLFEQVYEKQVS